MIQSPWLRFFILFCFCLSTASGLFARRQAESSVVGSVSDASGSLLPGISVVLAGPAADEKRSIVTNAEGAFRFEAVQPGHYTLELKADGFREFRQEIDVSASSAAKFNIILHRPGEAAAITASPSPKTDKSEAPGASDIPKETHKAKAAPSRNIPLDGVPPPVAAETAPLTSPAPVPGLPTADYEPGKNYVRIKVFYATDRKPTGKKDPASFFGTERGPDNLFSLGTCSVSIPRDHRIGKLEAPKIWKLQFRKDPNRDVVLLSVSPAPEDAFYQSLSANIKASPEKKAFVFIHGYDVSFEDAARRTAQLAYDLRFQGVPLFYSWPSKAAILGYSADEATIDWVRPHLKQFLEQVSARSDAESIYLVAHSMGNRILTRALQDIVAGHPADAQPRFKEVVLAAPDIDAGEFRQLAKALESSARHITLYASSKDKALTTSKLLHQFERAGESGDHLLVIKGIDTVDVSAIDTGLLGHSYVGDNKSVITDMFYLLSGMPAAQRSCLTSHTFADLNYWFYGPPGTAACPIPLPAIPLTP